MRKLTTFEKGSKYMEINYPYRNRCSFDHNIETYTAGKRMSNGDFYTLVIAMVLVAMIIVKLL